MTAKSHPETEGAAARVPDHATDKASERASTGTSTPESWNLVSLSRDAANKPDSSLRGDSTFGSNTATRGDGAQQPVAPGERLAFVPPKGEPRVLNFSVGDPYKSLTQNRGAGDVSPNGNVQAGKDVAKAGDSRGERPEAAAADPEQRLRNARESLGQLADIHLGGRQRNGEPGTATAFRADMRKFEERVASGQVSRDEVAKTYETTAKLLGAEGAMLNPEKRAQLARNIMHHAANPSGIDQGEYNTCAPTGVQERLFTRNPSVAADMVLQAAQTSKYRAPDGKEISLHKDTFDATRRELSGNPQDGDRSYATKIINNIIVNDIQQRNANPATYVQHTRVDRDGKRLAPGDNGERNYTADGKELIGEDGKISRAPRMSEIELSRALARYTGENGLMLAHGRTLDEAEQKGRLKPADRPEIAEFNTREQFTNIIKEMKDKGRLPSPIAVFADHRALNHGLPGPLPSIHNSGHIVSVTDYNPATNQVRISNQWGKASDRWMSVQSLYEASLKSHLRRGN